MTSHEARVRALVSSGQITESEGTRLVDALRQETAGWKILFNPFDRLSTGAIWSVAIVTCAASLAMSRLGIRFDGALDLHPTGAAPRWSMSLLDQMNAVALTAAVAWLVSLLVAKRGRFVDFVMTIGAARVPLIFIALVTHWLLPSAAEMRAMVLSGSRPGPAVVLASVLTLPFFFWFLALLYRAFVVSSGLKGLRAGLSFATAMVAAEVLSKVALVLIG